MSVEEDIHWFKEQFQGRIQAQISGIPFSVDLLTAIALQETGYLWRNLYRDLPVEEVLKLCVGDTIDAPSRGAFPKNKAKLVEQANGPQMFAIAREALEAIADHNKDYKRVARDPNKFCHGFGIFQYDLQFFLNDPDFFLERRWYDFNESLKHCVNELKSTKVRVYGSDKETLTDKQMVYVAIAYNTGKVDLDRGFDQGYFDGSKYYGQYIWEYLQLSKTVQVDSRLTRISWFELFRGQEADRSYPIVAGMDGENCIKLYPLKSRSIAELRAIFQQNTGATEFVVAPKNKEIPTPISED